MLALRSTARCQRLLFSTTAPITRQPAYLSRAMSTLFEAIKEDHEEVRHARYGAGGREVAEHILRSNRCTSIMTSASVPMSVATLTHKHDGHVNSLGRSPDTRWERRS